MATPPVQHGPNTSYDPFPETSQPPRIAGGSHETNWMKSKDSLKQSLHAGSNAARHLGASSLYSASSLLKKGVRAVDSGAQKAQQNQHGKLANGLGKFAGVLDKAQKFTSDAAPKIAPPR